MTINSTINRTSYFGDGITTAFDVPFAFFDDDELQVIERVTATGLETTKSLNNHYTVSGGDGTDGTVNATEAPPFGVSWTILRRTKRTQSIDYTNNDPFPAETHERGLDRVTMIAQDSAGAVDRALRFPASDQATLNAEIPNSMARAGKYLAFDSGGLPIASAGPTGDSSIPVSSFVETVLDDPDAATVRATLGLIIGTDIAPAGTSGDFVGRVTAYIGVTPPPGWLLLNGESIGNISSGATHQSADYEDLFLLFWESMGVDEVQVLPSRGSSASFDWGDGKALKLPDLRGRTIIGSGTGTGLTARAHGASGGAETHLLTAAQSGVPQHTHTYATRTTATNTKNPGDGQGSTATSTSNETGANTAAPAAEAHPNMQPFLALNYIVKW